MKRWILFLAAALSACVETPIVREDAQSGIVAVQPHVSGLDWKGIDLRFDVELSNPYPVPIVSPRFAYDLDVAGSVFLSGKEGTSVSIPASATGTVSLPIRIAYEDLWRRDHALFDANHVFFQLRGTLVFRTLGQNHSLPFSYAGPMALLRPLWIEPTGVRIVSHSPSHAVVEVEAAVTNPNMFAAGLQDMEFRFTFAELVTGRITAEAPREIGSRLKKTITLRGEVSGAEATIRLLREGSLGLPLVEAKGGLNTPYGLVRIP